MSLTRMQRKQSSARLNIVWSAISIGCLILGAVCGVVFADYGNSQEVPSAETSPYSPSPEIQVYTSPTSQIHFGTPEPELESLGLFTVYAYCPCEKCCGQWAGGPTASGVMPEEGRTVAADWDVISSGTEIYLDGVGWLTVEDTGSGITGNKLDIYMSSHQDALEWGVQEIEVFISKS